MIIKQTFYFDKKKAKSCIILQNSSQNDTLFQKQCYIENRFSDNSNLYHLKLAVQNSNIILRLRNEADENKHR